MPKKRKNSFANGLSFQEVLQAESEFYTIQVGKELFIHKGRFTFNKKSTIIFYNKVLSSLLYYLRNGTMKQKLDAKNKLLSFYVVPLRLH